MPLSPQIAVSPLSAQFRRGASFVPSGVAILTAPGVAMTVSTLQCVSFDPPLVSVCLERQSRKGEAIRAAGAFHARVLRAGEKAWAHGGQADAASIEAGLLELVCSITSVYEAGDHYLVVAEVESVSTAEGTPLVSWRRGLHAFELSYPFAATPATFAQFIADWETGTLPRAQWSHAAHVALGACYAVRHRGEALARTREGILRYNQATGTENTATSGYHETLTRFWAGILASHVAGFENEWEAACHALARYGEDRDLHSLYYSFDVARSTEARRLWIPPDLTQELA